MALMLNLPRRTVVGEAAGTANIDPADLRLATAIVVEVGAAEQDWAR